MTVAERFELVREEKRSRGCRCGESDPRRLLLLRPDGSGIGISRLLAMGSVTDDALRSEIARRVVVCRRCSRRVRPYVPGGGA